MTRKHLVTCSVIVLLVIISVFNICSAGAITSPKKTAKLNPRAPVGQLMLIYKTPDAMSFANETLPVNDAGIKRRLKHSLLKHNFSNVQSNILQSKAEKLFPLIEPILKAYGIPDDFKYVPLVEAGFGEGVSVKGAKGIWQFMPGTARTYGLKVGRGVDERTNVRKATIAACKYIRVLYARFNSWTLAAAAYNNGEIKLERAINRQKEDNYFRMHLNRETGAYVYNLVAMKAIISQPQKYGYNYYSLNNGGQGLAELLAIN